MCNMGCVSSNPPSSEANGHREISDKKQYSWDKRETTSQTEYMLSDVKGSTVCRHPGIVDGQPLTIQKCHDSSIFIFDHLASVTIDECTNCRIFIGPVKTSALVRDCRQCDIVVACQQFRASNSEQVDLFLCCSSRPVIESCSSMRFACHRYHYPLLEEQFNRAQLSVFNNSWAEVSDSSTDKDEPNFQVISEDVNMDGLVPSLDCCKTIGVSTDSSISVVPYTPPNKSAPPDSLCVVIFFCDGLSHERARTFIQRMDADHPECSLVQCREQIMEEEVAVTMFETDKYAPAVKQGAVIGLVYSGPDSCQVCQTKLVAVSCGSTGLVAISSSNEIAARQVDTFFVNDIPRLAPSSSIRLRR